MPGTAPRTLPAVLACALALALPIAAAPAAADPPVRGTGLARTVAAAERVVDLGVPGAVVAEASVRKQPSRAPAGAARLTGSGFSFGVGSSDLRRKRARYDTSAPFRIASVSKLFSAVVAMRLVERGEISLDDTVAEWLPAALPYGDQVTVEQLLGHRSGVFSYTDSRALAERLDRFPQGHLSPEQLVAYAAAEPLQFTPGTEYEYSNTDNVLVGLIAERATGLPYAKLLRREVFSKVEGGMRRTFLARSSKLPVPYVHGYLLGGERPEDVSRALNPGMAWASGGIVSTPEDLTAFMASLTAGRIVEPSSLRTMMRVTGPGNSDPAGPGRLPNRAGLGIFRYKLPCGVAWGHTGSFPGYRNYLVGLPGKGRSLLVGVNASAGWSQRAAKAILGLQRTATCALLLRK